MGRATAQMSTAATTTAPREAVPAEVHDGTDFEALNRQVSEYRQLSRKHGVEAALSHYAGEPVAVRGKRSS